MALITGLVLLAAVSCKSGGGDPKETVEHFFTALKDKKFDEAKKYATKESQSLLDMIGSLSQKIPDSTSNKAKEEKFDVTNVKINGDAATADVVPTDKSAGLTVNLKKEDGQWKVAFDKSSLMKMSMDQAQKQGVDVQKELSGALDSAKSAVSQSAEALDSLHKALDSLKK